MTQLDRESLVLRERNLLGHLLMDFDGKPFPDYVAALRPDWICNEPLHALIARSIWRLERAGRPRDVLAIAEDVKRHEAVHPDENLDQYLFELFREHTAFPSEIKSTCRLLADSGKRRDMRIALMEAINELGGHDSYEHALTAALGKIDGKATEGMTKGLLTANDIAQRGLAYVSNMVDGVGVGMSTGFGRLDELTYGFRAGELVTVAGTAGGGKTTAVTTIVENIAMDKDRVILVVSREMGEVQLAVRHFASLGNANARAMMTGQMADTDYGGITVACSKMTDMGLIYDLDSTTPAQIALKAAQVRRKYGRLDMVVVDHIGLISSDKQRRARFEEVTDITWALKTLAMQMQTCVIAVSQMNRDHKGRQDKAPKLTDLAESSSVEKDSDVVIGVHAHREGELKGYSELHVLKSRMGELGVCPAKFRSSRLVECSTHEFESARSAAERMPAKASFAGIN